MWSGPIHDTEFVTKVLSHVDESPDNYQTSTRMKGMLTLASKAGSFFLSVGLGKKER